MKTSTLYRLPLAVLALGLAACESELNIDLATVNRPVDAAVLPPRTSAQGAVATTLANPTADLPPEYPDLKEVFRRLAVMGAVERDFELAGLPDAELLIAVGIAANDNDTHQDTDQSQAGGGSGSDYTQVEGGRATWWERVLNRVVISEGAG